MSKPEGNAQDLFGTSIREHRINQVNIPIARLWINKLSNISNIPSRIQRCFNKWIVQISEPRGLPNVDIVLVAYVLFISTH